MPCRHMKPELFFFFPFLFHTKINWCFCCCKETFHLLTRNDCSRALTHSHRPSFHHQLEVLLVVFFFFFPLLSLIDVLVYVCVNTRLSKSGHKGETEDNIESNEEWLRDNLLCYGKFSAHK